MGQPVRGWSGLESKTAEARERFLRRMWEELPRDRAEVVYTFSWCCDWRMGIMIWETDTQWKKLISQGTPDGTDQMLALLLLMQGNESVPAEGQCHKTHLGVLTKPVSHPPSLHSDSFKEVRFHNSRHSVAAKPPQCMPSHVHCQGQAP